MPYQFPRCEILPLPDDRVSFRIDGIEKTQWHFGSNAPRPFFYPLNGPTGSSLTRMGHPGAPNHDHHRSVWFAHHKVLGINFWGDNTDARIRQKEWLAYHDGNHEAIMASMIHWYDGHNPQELLQQELVVAVRPLEKQQWELEVQATFKPRAESLEFGKTNFGFFAVRVAKNISEHFGGGRLTNSLGKTGERAIFGQPAQWMDYSGPVLVGDVADGKTITEGITFIDHPSNPGQPTRWHVREDGWMGASPGMKTPLTTTREKPLKLRYLLRIHSGPVDMKASERAFREFAKRPGFEVSRSKAKHEHNQARRKSN
ncbi:MAG: hypothetical protein Tsb009_22890 [Planctomycetaceae bacterium]